MRKLYAIEVGATRTRATVYYRLLENETDDLTDVTAQIAPRLHVNAHHGAIPWPADGFGSLADAIQRRCNSSLYLV